MNERDFAKYSHFTQRILAINDKLPDEWSNQSQEYVSQQLARYGIKI